MTSFIHQQTNKPINQSILPDMEDILFWNSFGQLVSTHRLHRIETAWHCLLFRCKSMLNDVSYFFLLLSLSIYLLANQIMKSCYLLATSIFTIANIHSYSFILESVILPVKTVLCYFWNNRFCVEPLVWRRRQNSIYKYIYIYIYNMIWWLLMLSNIYHLRVIPKTHF